MEKATVIYLRELIHGIKHTRSIRTKDGNIITEEVPCAITMYFNNSVSVEEQIQACIWDDEHQLLYYIDRANMGDIRSAAPYGADKINSPLKMEVVEYVTIEHMGVLLGEAEYDKLIDALNANSINNKITSAQREAMRYNFITSSDPIVNIKERMSQTDNF